MRRYTSFSALVGAFFSKDLYRDVAHAWSGIGFLHLVLLAFLGAVPLMISVHIKLNSFAKTDFPDLVKNFPEVRVHKGEVSSPIPQPYIVMDDSKPPKPMFVLDTTGQINNLDQTPAHMLITKTRFFTRDRNQQRVQELKDFPDVEVTPAKLRSWMALLATWFAPVGTLCLMFGSILGGLLGMMLLALFGAVISGSHSTISTSGYLRLASVARTPAFVLDTAFGLLGLHVPMWFMASFGVSFAYMLYAVTTANEVPRKPFEAAAPPPPEPHQTVTPPPQA